MKFMLSIELGNDTMQTYDDVSEALKNVRAYLKEYRRGEEIEASDNAPIRDLYGNTVGKWEVTADASAVPAPEPTAKDSENCRSLLTFVESSFRGATIGGLAIDDLATSLRTVLHSQAHPAREVAALPAPVTTPICPKCGKHNVTIRVDAYADYALQGWDKDGEVVAKFGTPDSLSTFDDRVYMCAECGYESQFRNGSEFQPA